MARTDAYWREIAQRAAERFIQVTEETKQFYFDAFALLTLPTSADERYEFYQGVDWNWLRTLDPDLWAKLSKDALSLEQRQRDARLEELKQFEEENYVFQNALRPQLSPYGYTPNNETASQLGFNQPIPLGRFG